MKSTKSPEIKSVNLFRACYGKWQGWIIGEDDHAEWDDLYRVFEAEDEIDAKWIAYTDPIQLEGYRLQMIERLVAVPLVATIDEF